MKSSLLRLAILSLSTAPSASAAPWLRALRRWTPRHLQDASAGDPDCPCLTTAQRSLVTGWSEGRFINADGTKVTLAGIDYDYPRDYGTNACTAHDAAQQPYCSKSDPPDWCTDQWCYVDPAACKYPVLSSTYFPGADLQYSYATCGSKNSFASWFGDVCRLAARTDYSSTLTDPPTSATHLVFGINRGAERCVRWFARDY